METYLSGIITNYLIMPVMAVFVAIITAIIAKKNQFLDKKMILYLLLGCIILVLPSIFGLFTYSFMPYIYLVLQLFYLLAGVLNLRIMEKVIKTSVKERYILEFLILLFLTIVSMAFFSLFFNLCNNLNYGIWASTCIIPFLFASLYRKAYHSFMDIPVEVYKLWLYTSESEMVEQELLESQSMFVVDVELTRNPGETSPIRLTAKVSGNAYVGHWFRYLLNEYNQKTPSNPIHCYDEKKTYGWVFYVKSSYFHARRYIDPDMIFSKNNLKAGCTIVARRVLVANKKED